MVVYERPIKFEDVDAANIVFFARYLGYAHEAMEHFFGVLPGGYSRLIVERKVGLPAVHVEVKFSSPARYGDVLNIGTDVARLGGRSAVLRYRMRQKATGALVAEVLWDWAMPEDEAPPTSEAVRACRQRLASA